MSSKRIKGRKLMLGSCFDVKVLNLENRMEEDEHIEAISYKKATLPNNLVTLQDVKRNLARTLTFNSLQDQIELNKNCYKTKMCEYLLRTGTCEFGSRCMYAHDESELRKPVCLFFKNGGFCKKGENCDYSHDLNDPVPQMQDQEFLFCASCYNALARDNRCYFCLYHELTVQLQDEQVDKMMDMSSKEDELDISMHQSSQESSHGGTPVRRNSFCTEFEPSLEEDDCFDVPSHLVSRSLLFELDSTVCNNNSANNSLVSRELMSQPYRACIKSSVNFVRHVE
jgi:hypothetical protein